MGKMPKEIQALQIRNHLGEVLNRVKYQHDLFLVKRGQEPMGVLMGFDDYQQLTGLVEKMSANSGSKPTSREIEEVMAQSKSLAELISQNEKLLAKNSLTVEDLLENLPTQREKYNQEKHGIKTTS